jgi:alpha-D-xyloside xylohydrolase
MASTLRGGLSIAMCGHPFWSHDIGGFHGQPTPDLYVRWAQLGLLSPLSRLHGMTTRMPWDYGDDALRIFTEFVRLRYRLLPYIFSEAVRAAETSLPLLRPMVLQYPHDPNTHLLDSQYMFGPDLLVAPILNPEGRRSVYLPEGDWYDFWTREVRRGPSVQQVEMPLDRIPLYARANALIPTIEPPDYIREGPFDLVTVDGYLQSTGTLELRDTDGTTSVAATLAGSRLAIDWSGPKKMLGFRLVPTHAARQLQEVIVNGRPLSRLSHAVVGYDSEPGWTASADGGAMVVMD